MEDQNPACRSFTAGIKYARHTAENPLDFMQKVKQVFNRRRCLFGFTCGMIGLPLSALISGAVNINNCRAQPLIEVWMIVVGSVALVMQVLGMVEAVRYLKGHDPDGRGSPVITIINFFGILTLFAWLIAGSVWLFGVWLPVFNNIADPNYCNGNYWYAFALLILGYIITVVSLVFGLYIFFSKKPDDV